MENNTSASEKYGKITLSVIAVLLFAGHLWFVYKFPDPYLAVCDRRDFEGLTWLVAYSMTIALFFLFLYQGYNINLPYVCYYLSILAGMLLLVWDVLYYINRNRILGFLVYSLILLIMLILASITFDYAPAMCIVQMPVLLRTMALYVCDCDKYF